MTLAGASWWAFNNFEVYATEGFDPLRYEYYARFGLPNYLLDSTSYRIVDILAFIYRFLPEYGGFVFVISLVVILVRTTDPTVYASTAVFSPICFYYLPQTGKDGIAILALIATMIVAIDFRSIPAWFSWLFVFSIALFVRPAMLIYVPIVVLQTRFGTRIALLIVPILILVFNNAINVYDATAGLEGIADDAGAGAFAQYLRVYSFGYDFYAIIAKSALFALSPVMQPAVGLLKFLTSANYFTLLEGGSYAVFLYQLLHRRKLFRFMVASTPYCIALGATSPFYHFRYLAVVYPVIAIYALYSKPSSNVAKAHLEPLIGQT